MSPECRDLIDRLLTSDIRQRLGHRGAGEARLSWTLSPGFPGPWVMLAARPTWNQLILRACRLCFARARTLDSALSPLPLAGKACGK